jgi:hypothetical protein
MVEKGSFSTIKKVNLTPALLISELNGRPAAARRRVIPKPRPLFAPVTTDVFPP